MSEYLEWPTVFQYSIGECVDQADIESNIECQNARSCQGLNEYSVSESADQADIGSNIKLSEYSDWPMVSPILN